jgi:hypothetical protein
VVFTTRRMNTNEECYGMRHNKSVNTDVQGRPLLRRSNSLGAGYVQRYAAWKGQSD